jgi:hypothetical protein
MIGIACLLFATNLILAIGVSALGEILTVLRQIRDRLR